MAIQSITHIATSTGASWVPLISGDGRYLLTNAYDPSFFIDPAFQKLNSLVLIDLETGRVRELPGVPDRTGYGKAYGIDADGGTLIVSGDPTGYANLHDAFGSYLVYVTGTAGGPTSTIDAYGDGKAQFVPAALTLSADGNHVVLDATRYDQSGNALSIGLFEVNLQSGAVTSILSQSWQGFYPINTQLAVSADGRYVVYDGNAFSSVTGTDPHNLYVYDTLVGSSRPVSTTTDGTLGNGFSASFAMSGNGRYVVFDSQAKNLMPAGSDGSVLEAVFVKDLQTGAIVAASADAFGHVGRLGEDSYIAQAISDDGRYVLFQSNEHFGIKELDGLVNGHVFVKDMVTGALALVNSSPETIGLDPHGAAISGDGKTIVFQGIQMVSAPTLHAEFQTYVLPLPTLSPVSANDILIGTNGADTLAGALGDDTYIVDNRGDIVVEYANQGHDAIRSTVDYSLPANVEVLALEGTQPINGNGNELDNLLIGNAAANTLNGGAGDDTFEGGGGGDTLNGGDGHDTARFSGKLADYTVTGGSLETVKAADGSLTALTSVETLLFSDATVIFDTGGMEAQAYRLYQAAFDRKPDLDGLGYWIKQMQHGVTLSDVAHGFTQSAEFKSVFGDAASNSTLVDLLYQHILHRPAEAAGAAYWTDLLDRHLIDTTQLLIGFSESAENQAALVGLAKSGIAYHPYGG